MKLLLPVSHFRHLKRLAVARRESVAETATFLIGVGPESDDNWIDRDPRYDTADKTDTRVVDFPEDVVIDRDLLLRKIQGLHPNIRAKTDGPIDEEIHFSQNEDGVQGITINGVTFYDPSRPGARDTRMFALLKDKFPPTMTVEEYRIFNVANSQFMRLIKESESFTMPGEGETAIDAGAFVGYKAFAMAHLVGPRGRVVAIEADADNYALLKRNIVENGFEGRITAVHCALSDKEEEMLLYTREAGTMAHSLAQFQGTGNPTAEGIGDATSRAIHTRTLADVMESLGLEHVDNLHVSVNGHEYEVLAGLGEACRNVGTFRVTCVFKVDGVLVSDKVRGFFERNEIPIAGRSGGALVAGPDAAPGLRL